MNQIKLAATFLDEGNEGHLGVPAGGHDAPVKHFGKLQDFFFLPLPPLSRAAVPAGPARTLPADDAAGEAPGAGGAAGFELLAGDALGVD